MQKNLPCCFHCVQNEAVREIYRGKFYLFWSNFALFYIFCQQKPLSIMWFCCKPRENYVISVQISYFENLHAALEDWIRGFESETALLLSMERL
jgi:hypothetical protein